MATTEHTPADDVRQRFGRVGGRLRPRLRGFWSWWLHALASWLPVRQRALFGLARERLLLRTDGQTVELTLDRVDAPHAIGVVPWAAVEGGGDPVAALVSRRVADLPRWLVLPPGVCLRRQLTLPAAAGDRLRDVLAFEIERQTPFTPATVHYDARIAGRRDDGQLVAELVVVPRPALEAALEAAGPLATDLSGVDVGTPDGGALGVNLLPQAQRRERGDPWRGWNLALAAIAVIAVAAGLWQVLANRNAAADVFEQQANETARKSRVVTAEKKQLVDLVEGMRFLQETRSGRPTTVEVLDELSRRLPDNTYLEKLSIENDRMLLIGLSGEASSLVQRLEGSPLWRAPALTGALQPDPRTRRDRFTLVAELAITEPPANTARTQGGAADARRQP